MTGNIILMQTRTTLQLFEYVLAQLEHFDERILLFAGTHSNKNILNKRNNFFLQKTKFVCKETLLYNHMVVVKN